MADQAAGGLVFVGREVAVMLYFGMQDLVYAIRFGKSFVVVMRDKIMQEDDRHAQK